MKPLARTCGLGKHYVDGDRHIDVLKDFDFEVAAGESVALTGPSGSGKSTLLNILAGIVPVSCGEVWLSLGGAEVPLHNANERQRTRLRRANIGYIYQFFNLVPTLTVLENIRLPAHLNKRKDLDSRAEALLAQLGLEQRSMFFRKCCLVESNNGWRWLGRYSSSRRCCWPTSPQEILMRKTQRWSRIRCLLPQPI